MIHSYLHILFFELSPICFMTNHLNYARWMVLYALELANLNPEVYALLLNGGFFLLIALANHLQK